VLATTYDEPVVSEENPAPRIVADPAVAFGEATVHGTRIWVALVAGLIADGTRTEDLLAEYPSLTEEDVAACLAFQQEGPPAGAGPAEVAP
jgi:uncharacterized protein (DUF433 family)